MSNSTQFICPEEVRGGTPGLVRSIANPFKRIICYKLILVVKTYAVSRIKYFSLSTALGIPDIFVKPVLEFHLLCVCVCVGGVRVCVCVCVCGRGITIYRGGRIFSGIAQC